jgi:hypothetical protein
MDTIDIKKLKRDKSQNNLYDLFIQSFNYIADYLDYVVVNKQFEMRLDFLCYKLYGSIEYIGFLMKLNDIFNPYSIKVGDIITYVPNEYLSYALYTDPKLLKIATDTLVSTIKSSNIDDARASFLNKTKTKLKLPPIVSTNGDPKQVVDDTAIYIAPTLFTNYSLGDIFNDYNGNNIKTYNTTYTQTDTGEYTS